ncbi:MAG: iron-sulfur cluster assembly scaffold protein [Deltaproteobacteria bacterium]|nr:iron-sulfur cluster assembly scaffold protein [Deltaproteobacteria bacterium]
MEKRHKHKARDHRPLHQLSRRFIGHANSPENFGRLQAPDGSAKGVGACGDSIELFLTVHEDRIKEIKHFPEGCAYTIACGSAVTKLARGQFLNKALELTPEDVARELGGLPEDHKHCAALAVNTLGEALDDYYQQLWGGRK